MTCANGFLPFLPSVEKKTISYTDTNVQYCYDCISNSSWFFQRNRALCIRYIGIFKRSTNRITFREENRVPKNILSNRHFNIITLRVIINTI